MESGGRWFRVALMVMVWGYFGPIWGEVQMKSREGQGRLGNRMSGSKSRSAVRSHLILDFGKAPAAETVKELAARGMRVVAYLPETGVVVGFDREPNLGGLDLAGYDALQPEDRLSAELGRAAREDGRGVAGARRQYYVVEFHGDVPRQERRALVAELGLEIRDHVDLVGEHMLVRGTLEQVRRLAEWDEVSYVFPASGELATGLPLIGCVGGATEAGLVGQQTQRVGEGWDGAGANKAELTYSFQAMTSKLGSVEAQAEIRRAMAAWSRVVQVRFQQTATVSAPKNINILFGAGAHGDPYPFDGAGTVLAHTFYPAPPNPEPIAGDLHFDAEEGWNIGRDIDLYSVALHELGHSLGLGHSDVPNAVMYPYYRRTTELTPEDIGAAQMLYAAVSGASPVPDPAPMAVMMNTAANATTTAATFVSLSGTVTGTATVPAVRWRTEQGIVGGAAAASDGRGGWAWQVMVYPLEIGENTITFTASDSLGRSATAVAVVRRVVTSVTPTPGAPAAPTPTPAPIPSPTPTPTPTPTPAPTPVLTIVVSSPSSNAVVPRNPTAASGTVAGATGLPAVRWTSDRGFSGTAVVLLLEEGRYRWDVNPLPLLVGLNTVTFVATDSAGRTSFESIRINHTDGEGEDPEKDVWPPQLKIVSPNTTFLMTTVYALAVRGTAYDPSGVAEVRWECTCGSKGIAQGTTNWMIPNITFVPGTYVVRVFAKDNLGNEGMAALNVFRYEN